MKYLFIVLSSILFQSSNTEWAYSIGTNGFDRARQIIKSNSGYYVFGETDYPGYTAEELKRETFVYKTDFDGNLLWAKKIGSQYKQVFCKGVINSNGTITMAIERYIGKRETLLLTTIDSTGNLLAAEPFDENNNEAEPYDLENTPDGGHLTVGFTKIGSPVSGAFFTALNESMHLYILKTNALGKKEYANRITIPKATRTSAWDIQKISATEYIVLGSYDIDKKPHPILCKINDKGQLLWCKTLKDPLITPLKLEQTGNGNIVLTGVYVNPLNNNSIPLLMCLNPNGVVLWTKKYTTTSNCIVRGLTYHNHKLLITGMYNNPLLYGQPMALFTILVNAKTGTLSGEQTQQTDYAITSENAIIDNDYYVQLGSVFINSGKSTDMETILIKKPLTLPKTISTPINLTFVATPFNIATSYLSVSITPLAEQAFGGKYTTDDTPITTLEVKRQSLNAN